MAGRVALITGGAGGMGRAIAETLLARGDKVCIVDINAAAGKRTEAELKSRYSSERVFFRQCELTSDTGLEDAIKEAINVYGHLDILCNNAGIVNEADWQKTMDVNAGAVIHGTILAFKYMGKAAGRDKAVIINTASDAGTMSSPFLPVYGASKHAVVGFTRNIGIHSVELYGIRVNCICPPVTDTAMVPRARQEVQDNPHVNDQIKKLVQEVSIVLQPSDVAAAVVDLIAAEDLSGAAVLLTPGEHRVLQLPTDALEIPYTPLAKTE